LVVICVLLPLSFFCRWH